MTVQLHPIVMTRLAEHRGADMQAQADRYRRAKLAKRTGGDRHQSRPEPRVFVAVAVALTLLVAGRAAAADAPSRTQPDLTGAAAHVAAPVPAEDDPETSTVQKVREAAL